jgi:thioredoxin 1
MIYPELVKLNAELAGKATIVKFNCNAYNKELGKTLGIKVAPTFHLYKGGEKVAEMTGAKVDKLRSLIEANV